MKDKKKAIYFAVELITIVAVTTFVFRKVVIPVRIDGESMYPTLENDDKAIVDAIHTSEKDVERFDIVVIEAQQLDKKIIKRVIGLPGERIVYKDDKLYINGIYYEENFLDEEYVKKAMGQYNSTYFTNDFEVEVPEGCIFVLGDNRLYSADSRVFGCFDYEHVVGKKGMVIFPPSNIKWMD